MHLALGTSQAGMLLLLRPTLGILLPVQREERRSGSV
jgi:hypothetical protein